MSDLNTNGFGFKGGTSGGGGGATTFTGLTDTPNGYTGDAGQIPIVNSTPDGLEFSNTPPVNSFIVGGLLNNTDVAIRSGYSLATSPEHLLSNPFTTTITTSYITDNNVYIPNGDQAFSGRMVVSGYVCLANFTLNNLQTGQLRFYSTTLSGTGDSVSIASTTQIGSNFSLPSSSGSVVKFTGTANFTSAADQFLSFLIYNPNTTAWTTGNADASFVFRISLYQDLTATL